MKKQFKAAFLLPTMFLAFASTSALANSSSGILTWSGSVPATATGTWRLSPESGNAGDLINGVVTLTESDTAGEYTIKSNSTTQMKLKVVETSTPSNVANDYKVSISTLQYTIGSALPQDVSDKVELLWDGSPLSATPKNFTDTNAKMVTLQTISGEVLNDKNLKANTRVSFSAVINISDASNTP